MSDTSIMPGADFGKTAVDYALHRAGPPAELFERLAAFGVALPGQLVCDLGSGTGALARPLAARGVRVIATDISRPLLGQARVLAGAAGTSLAGPVLCRAENVPLRDGCLDAITASQCWHWFERPAAAAECFRLVKPGGALMITHFDWLPLAGTMVEAAEALILQHNPRWGGAGGTGVYPRWPADAYGAGFREIETFSFDVDVPYSHEAWRGRIRASAGVGGSLTPEEVARFDAEHTAILRERFPAEPVVAPHRVWTLVGRKPV
jgi:ubiquinone/menaquinone biosynthesis C-methylase UbiE